MQALTSMSLSPGTRLASYEIVAAIGAGGMGEVYRAKDTKLDRLVAIKVLPASVAADPDRLARFECEAKAVAALSHPNILAIHDFSVTNGIAYAVTELLEGETLRQRLTTGALPTRKAVDIATQIARGLTAAHDRGIVHRDLKPENVFLLREGHVKILDFGLAKQTPTSSTADDHTQLATEPGMVLGTVGYMAPEQIRRQPIDSRADLFACGSILYEMLAGRRAFQRDTPAETMTAILNDDPPDLAPRNDLPPALERVVRHALGRDPNDRFQSARDLAFNLQAISQTIESGATGIDAAPKVRAFYRREVTAWALIAALAIAVGTLLWRGGGARAPARIANLTLNDEADLSASALQGVGLLVSPDGSRIFSQARGGERRVFMRNIDEPFSTPLTGTQLGRVLFISRDGQWLGFSTVTALKKISVVDGSVVSVCQTETITTSAALSADGQIVFSMGLGLWIVSADGGTPRALTALAGREQSQAVDGLLPDGRTLLFTNWLPDHPRIEALTLATGQRHVIVDQAAGGQYVSTGHLLFVRDGALLAAPLDLGRLATGAPVRVLDRVRTSMLGVPKLGVSSDGGLLAYAEPARASLVWVTRTGLEAPLDLPTRQYQFVRVSGDGRRVGFADEASVWVADLERGGIARVSSERFIYGSLGWSPDDSQLSYSALHSLVIRAVDGTGTPRRIGASLPVWKLAPSWSPDGKTIAYTAYFGATNADIYVEPADGSGPPRPFVVTPAYDAGPQFSPDGRFLAFASSETGRLEVYVTPFPGPGPKWPVSTNGGTHARWSRNGRELFYRNGDDVMAVSITTTPRLSAGKPLLLFRGRYSYGSGLGLPTYDVAPDGRFLMIRNDDETVERPHIIINWAESLKQLTSAR
jgi:Tol biopolymer transport system component